MDTAYLRKLVRTVFLVLVVLVLVATVWDSRYYLMTRWQEHQFRYETPFAALSESEVLHRLPTASPRQVLEFYFWGLNNSSTKVVNACLTELCADIWEGTYKSPGARRLSLIEEKSCDGRWGYPGDARWFTVRYRHGDEIVQMDYVLIREGPKHSWKIAQWGNG